jgi:hypothetical protein
MAWQEHEAKVLFPYNGGIIAVLLHNIDPNIACLDFCRQRFSRKPAAHSPSRHGIGQCIFEV